MSGVKEERSISLLLRLDLEFLESTPKTLINSLHATARNFDTPSYWTLTQYLVGHENSKTTMDIYARVKYNKPEELFEVVNDALNQENFDEKSPISMVKE